MMKSGQLVFIALSGGCAVLLLSAGLMLGGVGMEVQTLLPKDHSRAGDQQTQASFEPFRLPSLEDYAVIVERPLFNDDRLPQLPSDEIDNPGGDGTDIVGAVALDVTVNGIIITPDFKIAMLTDNVTKETLRLRENMPLEGDQGVWVLRRIEPRMLVFEGGGEEPVEVELLTHTKALKGGQAARSSASNKQARSAQAKLVQERRRQAENSDQDDQQQSDKAEEIRRRVAERRAQLRAEAARRRAEQDGN